MGKVGVLVGTRSRLRVTIGSDLMEGERREGCCTALASAASEQDKQESKAGGGSLHMGVAHGDVSRLFCVYLRGMM